MTEILPCDMGLSTCCHSTLHHSWPRQQAGSPKPQFQISFTPLNGCTRSLLIYSTCNRISTNLKGALYLAVILYQILLVINYITDFTMIFSDKMSYTWLIIINIFIYWISNYHCMILYETHGKELHCCALIGVKPYLRYSTGKLMLKQHISVDFFYN